eukprot:244051_1
MATSDVLDTWVKLTSKSDGRDKFNKLIQYGARYLAYRHLSSDPKDPTGLKLRKLFVTVANARKLDRLFNTLKEIRSIKAFLAKADSQIDIIQAASRSGFALYWLFDNLVFLSRSGFLQADAARTAQWGKSAMRAWMFGVTLGLVVSGYKIKNVCAEMQALKETQNMDSKKRDGDLERLRSKTLELALRTFGSVGDFVVSGQGSGFLPLLLGTDLDDGVLGAAGMVPALVALYFHMK